MSAVNDKTPMVGIPWDGARDEFALRDWFAGQALGGMLANAEFLLGVKKVACGREQTWIAAHSYELADAMLAAREART